MPLAKALKERMELTYNMHVDSNDFSLKNTCGGCSLCNTNLIVFPEGTTTNGSCLLSFRKGVFNAGLPVKPIVFRFPWKSVNTTWESAWFTNLTFRMFTQFNIKMEIIECPPYIPNKYEREDPSLYAFNVSLFMARMMEYDTNFDIENKNMSYSGMRLLERRVSSYNNKPQTFLTQLEIKRRKKLEKKKEIHCPIYILNRDHKKGCYHRFLLGWSSCMALKTGYQFSKRDETLKKYRQWIDRYCEYLDDLEEIEGSTNSIGLSG